MYATSVGSVFFLLAHSSSDAAGFLVPRVVVEPAVAAMQSFLLPHSHTSNNICVMNRRVGFSLCISVPLLVGARRLISHMHAHYFSPMMCVAAASPPPSLRDCVFLSLPPPLFCRKYIHLFLCLPFAFMCAESTCMLSGVVADHSSHY